MFLYMCMQFDKNRQRDSLGNPAFFPNYKSAKQFAIKNARIIEPMWLESIQMSIKKMVFYYKIFELPYGQHVIIDDDDPNYGHYELYQSHIETVYDPVTTAAMLIQKCWRVVYHRRFVAAVIIKRELRKAIANPYTEICKRRLLREFREISNDFN